MAARKGDEPMSTGPDLESTLRQYLHEELDELKAPAAMVEAVWARAVSNPETPPAPSAYPRRWTRLATGVAAAAALGVAVTWTSFRPPAARLMPNAYGLHSAATQTVAAGAASVSGRLTTFASSAGHRLWLVGYLGGEWQLWTRAANQTTWRLATKRLGPRAPMPALSFQGARGLFVVPSLSGVWRAEETQDNGKIWSRAALPEVSTGYAEVALAQIGPAIYADWAGNLSRASELYQREGRTWQKVDARGLPRRVSALAFYSGGSGSLLADGQLYSTSDGGAAWQTALPTAYNGVETAAPSKTAASAVSPEQLSRASLEGLAVRRGETRYAAEAGFLWKRVGLQGAWRKVAVLPAGRPETLAAEPSALYLFMKGGPLYVSRDGGKHWSRGSSQ